MKKTISILLVALAGFLNAQVIPLSSIKWGCNLDSNANDVKGINNGTVTGCTFNGYPNGCTFNGTSDYIQYNNSAPFNMGGINFDKLVCVNFTSNDTAYIEGSSDAAKTPSTQGLYVKRSNGIITIGFYQNKGIIFNELSSTIALNDGQNHCLLFTKSTYGGSLYIDGNSTPVATYNTYPALRSVNNSPSPYCIGRLGNYTTGGYADGKIMCSFIFNSSVGLSNWSYLWNGGNVKRFPFN